MFFFFYEIQLIVERRGNRCLNDMHTCTKPTRVKRPGRNGQALGSGSIAHHQPATALTRNNVRAAQGRFALPGVQYMGGRPDVASPEKPSFGRRREPHDRGSQGTPPITVQISRRTGAMPWGHKNVNKVTSARGGHPACGGANELRARDGLEQELMADLTPRRHPLHSSSTAQLPAIYVKMSYVYMWPSSYGAPPP